MKRNALREAAFKNEIQISSLFETNVDLAIMRKPFTKEFMKTWEAAFKHYTQGQWQEANELFSKILELKPGDKPTLNIQEIMQEHGMEAPVDWKGYHHLDH